MADPASTPASTTPASTTPASTTPASTAAASAVIESELRFLDPAVFTSPTRLGELLHPDFRSFGSSGRAWNRETLITELRARGSAAAPPTVSRMKAVELSPGVVLVTFDANVNGRRAHRSSLWRLTGPDWLLYFHQGTEFTPDETPGD